MIVGVRRGEEEEEEEEERRRRRGDVGDWESSLCLDWQIQTWLFSGVLGELLLVHFTACVSRLFMPLRVWSFCYECAIYGQRIGAYSQVLKRPLGKASNTETKFCHECSSPCT